MVAIGGHSCAHPIAWTLRCVFTWQATYCFLRKLLPSFLFRRLNLASQWAQNSQVSSSIQRSGRVLNFLKQFRRLNSRKPVHGLSTGLKSSGFTFRGVCLWCDFSQCPGLGVSWDSSWQCLPLRYGRAKWSESESSLVYSHDVAEARVKRARWFHHHRPVHWHLYHNDFNHDLNNSCHRHQHNKLNNSKYNVAKLQLDPVMHDELEGACVPQTCP